MTIGKIGVVVVLMAMLGGPGVGFAQDKSGERHQGCNITVKNSGSGANLINVCISNHGNLFNFATPSESIFREGYAVCRTGATYVDYDVTDSGWEPATTTSLAPVTIVRTTTDGVFTMTQKFTVDATEKDLTITVMLKNNSAVTQTDVQIMRGGDFDIGGSSDNIYDRSADSVFGRVGSEIPTTTTGQGMSLTATTFATPHSSAVHSNPGTSDCSTTTMATPAQGDLAGRVVYAIGSINPGQTKTVKFSYRKL